MNPAHRFAALLVCLSAPACNQDVSVGNTSLGGGTTTDATTSTSAGPASGESTSQGESTSRGDSSGAPADASESSEGPKWDVGALPDVGEPTCSGGKGGVPEFSYLWAANSAESTISKIDTETVTELGRYVVRPDSAGNPSRTSVSLAGHVAVANRYGGVTKVYATSDLCEESNGTAGIQTSNSPVALAWGEEECVAWYTPLEYESQRPVAWTPGTWNETACTWVDEKLWTSGTNGAMQFASTDVLLLDGDTGTVIDQVTLGGDYTVDPIGFGLYGGASDAEGNFWATQLGGFWLVRVDIDDLSYEVWPVPTGGGYGITVDDQGYVWVCADAFSRFDPTTETWMTGSGGGYAGCMAAAGDDGLLWMGGSTTLIGVDRETLTVAQSWPVPGSYGISIDYYGYVWAVEQGDSAHRIDPVDGTVTSYDGLVGAYTYSDMTGYALANAGVGVPSG